MRRWSITFAPLLLLTLRCSAFGEAGGDGGGDAAAPDASVDVTPEAAPACDAATPECDLVCQGSVCALATSCKALHEARPELGDGLHYVDFDGDGSAPPQPAWCDMTTDGGGWTLVARSVRGIQVADFGWTQTHGDLTDDAEPYSLDAVEVGIAFTEILFGARGPGKTWSTPVFKHAVPASYLDDYRTSGFTPPGGAVTVLGKCAPPGGPLMLAVIGWTDEIDHFSFRDKGDAPGFGLFSDEWNTNGAPPPDPSGCTYAASLHGKEGMLFVR